MNIKVNWCRNHDDTVVGGFEVYAFEGVTPLFMLEAFPKGLYLYLSCMNLAFQTFHSTISFRRT